ncbi:ComEA family DNA-binding protein [bacterium]|nr:ComEA family DNA-binding protein [bacterium]
MSQKQITVIIIEIILILLGIVFYFIGDQYFNKKNNMQHEILQKNVVALKAKLDAYEKLDTSNHFTKKFLSLQKEQNHLEVTFAENNYNEALQLYTELITKTENLKSEIGNYNKEQEMNIERGKLKKQLAAKDRALRKKKAYVKPKVATTQPKVTKTTTTKPAYTYEPLKKTNTTTSEPAKTTEPKVQTNTVSNEDNSNKIDINNAGAEELQKLPRIGPVKSKSIIDYRNSHNGFQNVDDLVNVSGIGPKTMASLKPLIYCGSYDGEKSGQSAVATRTTNKGKININTASFDKLQELPRVGPKLAQSIIDYRNENGNFRSYEDLLNVPRIGEKTLETLKPYIILGDNK